MAVMILDPYEVSAWNSIKREADRQAYRTWPKGDWVRQAGICCEEAGEVMKEALDITRVHQDARVSLGGRTQEETAIIIEGINKKIMEQMYAEATQLAFSALMTMTSILKHEEARRAKAEGAI